MQKLLQGKSFPALWDHVILLRGRAIRLSEITVNVDEAVIIVPFASHLRTLMVGFELPASTQQTLLLPAIGVRGRHAS